MTAKILTQAKVNEKSEKSGVVGVTWRKESRRWRVRLIVNGKPITIGVFDSLGDAIAARKRAELKHNFRSHPPLGAREELTQEMLKDELCYSPSTGLFVRRTHSVGASRGQIAGGRSGNGYVYVQILGRKFPAHRLAFLYMTGKIPPQVDHINHKRSDNRWSNLRAATSTTNAKNLSMSSNNTSGTTGVSWCGRSGRWIAEVTVGYKKIHLGSFDALDDAADCRAAANEKYGFHENHGI